VTLFLHADGEVEDIPIASSCPDPFAPVMRFDGKTFDRYSRHLRALGRCTVLFLERAVHQDLDERVRVALYHKYVAPKRLPPPPRTTAA